MVFNNDHPEVQLTGHMDLCRGADDDEWWAVFLAVRPQPYGEGKLANSQLGRETFLCPVEWKDDWPIVNKGKPVTLNGLAEAGLERLPEKYEERYDFDSDGTFRGKLDPQLLIQSDSPSSRLVPRANTAQATLRSFPRARSSCSLRQLLPLQRRRMPCNALAQADRLRRGMARQPRV
jgi:hypothetical protein